MIKGGRPDRIVGLFYLLFLCLTGYYCFKNPLYNWDMLPYMNLVLRMDQHNEKQAHQLTYQLTSKGIPEENYRQLTDSTHDYRSRMLNSPEAFSSQLPFYVVKPLYIGLIYVFYKSGLPLPMATLLPSLLAYLLIGLLLFYWLAQYLSLSICFITSSMIMVSPPLTEIAKISSPDCLSAFFLLGAFYFLIQRPSLWAAFGLMLLSVFTRLDNFLTCFLLICILYITGKWFKKISASDFAVMIALLMISYVLVGLLAMQYGWSIFFYNDFANRLHPVYGSGEEFSTSSYLRLVYEHAISGLRHSSLAIFMALLAIILNRPISLKRLEFGDILSLCIPVIILTRFILYPDISDRFYIAFYLVIVVLLVKKITQKDTSKD